MFAEWTAISPAHASATLWYQWIFQHQLLAITAIVVALFPQTVARLLARRDPMPFAYAFRAALLVGGLSLATWVPPPVVFAGASGFLNELFGSWGFPAAWGAVAPIYVPGLALYARWGLQYLLLGGYAVALALAPGRALSPVLRTWAGPNSSWGSSRAALRSPRSFGPLPAPHATPGPRSEPPVVARGLRDP
jgi:hypothetical protein